MFVGTAQIDITPEFPFFLAGSAKMRVSKEKLDPLMASCVIVENEKNTVAFIGCDLINIKEKVIEAIRNKVNKETGISKNHIIISATHTHQGPKTGPNMPAPWIELDQKMVDTLADKIASSAITAFANKKEARMGYDKGSVDKCSFNRRCIMSNGKSEYAMRDHNPEKLMAEGPVDKEVQTVWFENMQGKYIAVMVNFSCHPTVLFCTEYVSADFPGAMRRVVQGVVGSDVPVLYLQGACGNINNVDTEDDNTVCEGIEGLERFGRILGGEVLKLISQNNAMNAGSISIDVRNEILDIPLRSISDEEIEAARAKWEQYTDEVRNDFRQFKETYHTWSTVELGRQINLNPDCRVEISAVRLGDIFIVTNPVELFVEYQLVLKSMFKDKKIMVAELTNGAAGYVPTKLAFALGGYEMRRAISSKLDREAGKMIVESSAKLIEEISK